MKIAQWEDQTSSDTQPPDLWMLKLCIQDKKAGTHLPKPARLGGRVGFLNVFSGLNQPETDDPCARGRETKHKEARESNIIWRELKHRRNTSLWAEQRGAIKLVAFAENSKHNNGQNKGQNFRVFQGSKWNYKLDYTLWVPLIIICIVKLARTAF